MILENVKGFRDILYPDSLKRQKIKEIIEKNFKLFGFMPIETSTIEYDEFARGENEKGEAVSDRFRLKDRGGRELSLRYEFTFQLKRIFKKNPNIKLPFRRYQVGYNFRDEPITKDRYREFMQCDADIIGEEDIISDAECIFLCDKICKDLGIKYELILNNRKLLNLILEKSGIKNKELVSKELDKIDKLEEKEVKENLINLINKKEADFLFKLLKKDLKYFLREQFDGAEELNKLISLCKKNQIDVKFSAFLIRGFSYYTGNIFEGYVKEIKGSVFAGGRYDNLVGKYINRQIPAVGISFGRILDYPNIKTEGVNCLIISIDQDEESIELVKKLREKEISCFIMKKINKALDYAAKMDIPFVVFVGKDEIKEKKIKLREMKTGKEKLLGLKELIQKLTKLKDIFKNR